MELTQEHFDNTLSHLYKKLDKKIDQQTDTLKTFVREQTEELARIITTASLEEQKLLTEKLDVRERIGKLESQMQRLRAALNLSDDDALPEIVMNN